MHAVIFDIDGTLLQSMAVDDALYRQAVADVLGDVTLRASLHEYEFITDTGVLRSILEDNEIDPGDPRGADVRARFVELLDRYVNEHGPFQEIPGAREFLRTVAESPVHAVAMATGGWRDSAELKLRTAGIDYDDIPLVTANDHYERTGIMEIALAQLVGEFESVSYYGDGPWDRAACAALGWQFVAVGPDLAGLESYIGHAPVFNNIRAMTTSDMDAIFHVRTSVVDNHRSEEQLAELGVTRDRVAAMLERGEVRGWCALSQEQVVGFSLATGETREVNALFVLPESSGRGLGQALLDIAVHHLRRQAPGIVRLRTDPQLPAYRFYTKRGWRDTGKRHANGDDVFLELE